jgi:hypothetical protein
LFSKLKSHELSRKVYPNHDASFTSKALMTSPHVVGHDANPTNTISPSLDLALSYLAAASNEQYESIPNDEVALLARKLRAMYKFRKERRRKSKKSRGYFKCGDTTHFIADCPKRKKFNSTNKNDYANLNDSSNKGDNKKKNCFRDNKKKRFQKIMSRACAALSDFDFSSEDSSCSEEVEKIKCMKDNFVGLCLMGKSSQNDFDSDVSDDLSF